ncbi:MAG TPA: hypothetical protein VIM90_10075 [Arenimonas sp.]
MATAAKSKRSGKAGADIRPRPFFLAGLLVCLAVSGCAHRVPASLKPSVGDQGAFASSAVGVGSLFWVRTYSYLPGPAGEVDWQLAASSGPVGVFAPADGIETTGAATLARDVEAAIGFLYPQEGALPAPVQQVEVYLVPDKLGVSEQHSSLGTPGRLSVRFYVRNPGTGILLDQRAYVAGTVAHELVHIQRRLSRISLDDTEEPIASLLEACAVLSALGQVSPTFSEIASRSPASDREQEMLSSARAAASLANSLPPTVHAGSEHARDLLASCAVHWEASTDTGVARRP